MTSAGVAADGPAVTVEAGPGVDVLRLLDAAEVESLRWAYSVLGPTPGDGDLSAFRTAHCPDAGYRQAVREVLVSELAAPLARAGLGDAPVIDAGYVMAWPGPRSGEGVEAAGPPGTIAVFVALDEVTGDNGGLWVVPPGGEATPSRAGRMVSLQRGEAAFVPATCLTFTLPNRIDKPRLGITLVLRAAAPLPGAHDGTARVGSEPPAEAPRPPRDACISCGTALGALDDPWARATPSTCSACRAAAESAPAWAPPAVPSAGEDHQAFAVRTHDVPWERAFVTSLGGPVPPSPLAERVLVDADLDAALERDGYVAPSGPLLDPARARDLRSAFLALHGSDGQGFHNDFNDRDTGYRRAASRLVAEALDPLLDELFVDHVGFIHPFLCKYPGDASYFKPHRDWMYVDERAGHRSFVLFVALEDITEANGQVQLLPGSHRLDTMLRGTLLEAPWMRESSLLTDRMRPMPRSVGEVVVWDHATVHGSLPNLTRAPRLAAAVWVAPAGVELLHYRRLDDSRAWRHEVGTAFWDEQNPFRLLLHPPSDPVTDIVDIGGAPLTAAELEQRLDRLERERHGGE